MLPSIHTDWWPQSPGILALQATEYPREMSGGGITDRKMSADSPDYGPASSLSCEAQTEGRNADGKVSGWRWEPCLLLGTTQCWCRLRLRRSLSPTDDLVNNSFQQWGGEFDVITSLFLLVLNKPSPIRCSQSPHCCHKALQVRHHQVKMSVVDVPRLHFFKLVVFTVFSICEFPNLP